MVHFEPAWLGYGALLALLATSLVARIDQVRLGLAAAALLALPAVALGWQSAVHAILILTILLVNLGLILRLWFRDSAVAFSPEEQELRRAHFVGLPKAAARALIDEGHWISARRGEVLIRENQAVPSLFYISAGSAAVLRDGNDVGTVTDGALIGEATVLDGASATGTVVLTTNARLWFIPAPALRAHLAANPEVAEALHEGFALALRGKLAAANTRIARQASL